MNTAVSNKSMQSVLIADAIRKALPIVCKKDVGIFKSLGAIKNIASVFNQMLRHDLISGDRLISQTEAEFQLMLSNVRDYSKTNLEAHSWPSFLNDIRSAVNSLGVCDAKGMMFGDTLYILASLLIDDVATVINVYAKRSGKGNRDKIAQWFGKMVNA